MSLQLGAVLSLRDSNFTANLKTASSRISAFRTQINEMSKSMEEARIKMSTAGIGTADRAKALKDLEKLEKKYNTATQQIASERTKIFKNAGKEVLSVMQKTSLAIVGLSAVAAKKAMDFEQSIANIKAVTGASSKEMNQLRALALKMGRDTEFSAMEAAGAIGELAKAGLTTEQIIKGGLEGALSLATAGELDLAAASEIASTALNTFKKDNLTVANAADILAGAANASATDVEGIRSGLAMVGNVANTVGLSFKDTATALAVFAQNGLKGSDAGTSLKTMLLNLQPKTDDAYFAMQRLGIVTSDTEKMFNDMTSKGFKPATKSLSSIEEASKKYYAGQMKLKTSSQEVKEATESYMKSFDQNKFFTTEGKIKSLADISDILKDSLKDLNEQERLDVLNKMFGTDAIRASAIFFKEGAKGITEMQAAMSKVTAKGVAAEKLNTLNGKIKILKGSLETLAIDIGNILLPPLTSFVKWLTELTNKFINLDPATKKLLVIIGGVVVGITALITVGIAFASVISAIQAALLVFNITLTSTPIGWIIIGVVALVAAIVLLIMNWDSVTAALKRFWEWIKTTAAFIWQGFISALQSLWTWIKNLADSIWQRLVGAIQSAWNWLKNIVTAITNFVTQSKPFTSIVNSIAWAWEKVSGGIKSAWQWLTNYNGENKNTKSKISGSAGITSAVGHNAGGTNNWRGGLTWVGEKGPELLNLPRGSKIIPNNKLAGGTSTNVNISINGLTVREEADIDKIARRLADMIGQTSMVYGGT